MSAKRFIMNAGRTSKQGQQINIGKDHAEYQAIVSTLTMHPDDMKALTLSPERRFAFAPSMVKRNFYAKKAKFRLAWCSCPMVRRRVVSWAAARTGRECQPPRIGTLRSS